MAASTTSYNPSYRYGDNKPIEYPIKQGVAVNVGDLVYIDTSDGNTVKPAMSFTWTTNLATTQPLFVKQFAGVAAQPYDGSNFVNGYPTAYGIQSGNLRVDTAGTFDFPCASTTWNAGDLVGPDQDGANSNLYAQRVVNVNGTGVGAAIGRVVQSYSTATTSVRVEIFAPFARLVNAGNA